MREYPAENALLLLVSYRAILLSTASNHSFPVSIENYGVASILYVFKPSAPRLQGSRWMSATNLVHHRNAIISFFMLNHTRFTVTCLSAIEW